MRARGTKKVFVATPPQPQFERVEIQATPNGFVVWSKTEARDYSGPIAASFESRRSLIAWLSDRLVQR